MSEDEAIDANGGAPDGLSAIVIDDQLRRMLSSTTFSQAPRSGRLLRYLVEHAMTGRPGELKEYALGVHVFDRGAEFDPRTDSVVRVQARRLRQRLDAYYAGEGRDDPLRIGIPKGHYQVQLHPRQSELASAGPAPVFGGGSGKRRRWRRGAIAATLSGIVVSLAVMQSFVLSPGDAGPARALNVPLDGSGAGDDRGAGNPQAETAFLRGRFFHHRRGPRDAERARQHLEQAVTLDPRNARAWAALSGAYAVLGIMAERPDRRALQAAQGRAAETAVALDPSLAEARSRLGHYLKLVGNEQAARAQYQEALRLDPHDVLTMGALAGSFLYAGDLRQPVTPTELESPIELTRRCVDRDPISVVHRYNLASLLVMAGRLDEALLEFVAIQELLPATGTGEFHSAQEGLARVLVLLGRWNEALELVAAWPVGRERSRYLAMIHDGLGRADAARQLLHQGYDVFTGEEMITLAEVFAFLGDRDAAFDWLARTIDQVQAKASLLPIERRRQLRELSLSPFLAPLAADDRWAAWLERANAAVAS